MPRYFLIGELARLYQINADTLRFYEELGLLKPTRMSNGYRRYSPQDVWRLNVIRDLRALGIPLERIGELLQKHNALSTLQFLESEEALVEKKLYELHVLADNLRQRNQALRAALKTPIGSIQRYRMESRNCYTIVQGYRSDEEMDVLIQQLLSLNPQSLYLIGNDQIGSFVDISATFEEMYRKYTGVFILHEDGKGRIPAGTYLSVCYRGDCSQNSLYIPMLLRYAAEHRLMPQEPLLELMRTDIHISNDPEEHVTELQLRVSSTEN